MFRVSGQVFHGLPPLIPAEEGPRHFQLYFWDNENELHHRMKTIDGADVDEKTMVLLTNVMKVNPYAQLLRNMNQ